MSFFDPLVRIFYPEPLDLDRYRIPGPQRREQSAPRPARLPTDDRNLRPIATVQDGKRFETVYGAPAVLVDEQTRTFEMQIRTESETVKQRVGVVEDLTAADWSRLQLAGINNYELAKAAKRLYFSGASQRLAADALHVSVSYVQKMWPCFNAEPVGPAPTGKRPGRKKRGYK